MRFLSVLLSACTLAKASVVPTTAHLSDIVGVPPAETRPGRSLHEYHDECKSPNNFRTQQCVSAMHRYCMYTVGFDQAIAIPQEASAAENQIGFLCAPSRTWGEVEWSSIPSCQENSQSPNCYVDVGRYCGKHEGGPIGIIQEVGLKNSMAAVGCVPAETFESVKMTVLQGHHEECVQPGQAQTGACAAAVHQYCSKSGNGQAGIATELGRDEIVVGCVRQGTYVSAQV